MAKRTTQSAIFKKANQLMREGMGRPQAFKVAYSELGEPVRKTAATNPRHNPLPRVSEATAKRLNEIADEYGYRVRIVTTTKPKRRFYSIGNFHSGSWHQVTGSTYPDTIENFLRRTARKNPRKKTVTRARPTTTIKLFSNPKRKTATKKKPVPIVKGHRPRSTYTDYIVSESANGKTGWKVVATFLHEKNAVEYAHALEHKNAIEKRSRYIQITTQLHELRRKSAA